MIFSLQVEGKWLEITQVTFSYTIPVVRKDPGLLRLWSLLYLFSSILPPVTTSPLGWAAAVRGWVVLVLLKSRDSCRVTPGTISPCQWGDTRLLQIPKELATLWLDIDHTSCRGEPWKQRKDVILSPWRHLTLLCHPQSHLTASSQHQ